MNLDSVIGITFLSRWRFYLLLLSASWGRLKGEQCSFSCRSRHFYTWAIPLENHYDAYTSWYVSDSARHVGCISL